MLGAQRIAKALRSDELTLLAVRDRRQVQNAVLTFMIQIGAGNSIALALAVLISQSIRADVELRSRIRCTSEANPLQLQDQAAELEAQQVELEAQTDDLRFSNDDLQAERAADGRCAIPIALARVQRSNEELDQFAYVASHDLKAPLRGIANLATWLEEDLAGSITSEGREHMTLLRGRVQRMEALIDGILLYSRAGRVGAGAETVDVAAAARRSWSYWRRRPT